MRYLTDGVHLYEVASQRMVRNYGRRGGTIGYTILRDCIDEAIATMDDLQLAALTEVKNGGGAVGCRSWIGGWVGS